MSLYNLTKEFLLIKSQLEDMELDADTLKDTLDSLQLPIEQKVENTIKYIKNLEYIAEAKSKEAKRLAESAASDLKKVERLKKYISTNLKSAGINEMQAGIFGVKFRKGSEAVKIDESKLPKQYWEKRVSTIPIGKTILKKLIQQGEVIDGVEIVKNPDTLIIK